VGIGTTGPDAKLVVKDDSNVVYDASAYQKTFIIEKKNTNGDDQFANIKFNVTGYEGQTTGEASIGVVQTSNANSGNLVFGTRNNGTRSEKMRITSGGDVGIGTTDPKAKLDVNNVFCVDSKEHTITNAFTTCLTVNLTSHTGCHVVITAFGDWGNHSSAAYRGEFFLQNGATIYNEPGIILRQDDNTSDGTDQIICQIVDPASTADPKDFQIQIRHTDTTSPTGFDAQLTYTVQGIFNSIT
jgi:hypothetical protein